MNKTKILAANIKKYRLFLGITQEELAQRLFVTPQAVSKWETGLALPDVENLIKLADVFSVSADTLLGRDSQAQSGAALIGIDGGGTKTEFVLFLSDGRVLNRLVLGGCNPNIVGINESCRVLSQGIDTLLAQNPSVEFVFMGIAGARSGNNTKSINSFMKKNYPYLRISLDSDIVNIIYSSGDPSDCIAAICGTGSVVYASVSGNLHRTGGWGYLFDGAGSGFDIGREVLRACLAKDDGMGAGSIITELAEEKLGGKAFDKIDLLYSGGKDFIASFAPIAFEAYSKGDVQAEKIIRQTTDRLALLISGQSEKFDGLKRVVISGGLTAHREILEKFITEKLPDGLSLIFPSLPPIFGAAAKCLTLFDNSADLKAFEKIFSATYKELV